MIVPTESVIAVADSLSGRFPVPSDFKFSNHAGVSSKIRLVRLESVILVVSVNNFK